MDYSAVRNVRGTSSRPNLGMALVAGPPVSRNRRGTLGRSALRDSWRSHSRRQRTEVPPESRPAGRADYPPRPPPQIVS
jgi:hypothetical protein